MVHPQTPKTPTRVSVTKRDRSVRYPVLIQRADGLSISKPAVVRRTTLWLPDQLTMETWQDIGQQITTISESSSWWIADWIVFGQEKFPDRYKVAAERTGLSYKTLRNYAWVSRRFSVSRRRENLSFQHHALVAAIEESEQDEWLDRAARENISATELRRRLKAKLACDQKLAHVVNITFTEEKVVQWRAAAEAEKVDLLEWATSLLDRAAERTLRSAAVETPEGYLEISSE